MATVIARPTGETRRFCSARLVLTMAKFIACKSSLLFAIDALAPQKSDGRVTIFQPGAIQITSYTHRFEMSSLTGSAARNYGFGGSAGGKRAC